MKCFVSAKASASVIQIQRGTIHIPCVTKLPKFLPTMQCHVAPFRLSNLGGVSGRSCIRRSRGLTSFLMNWAMSWAEHISIKTTVRPQEYWAYLFNGELFHGQLRYWVSVI